MHRRLNLPEVFLLIWTSIVRELIAARSWREAIGVLFGPPGWRADGKGLTSANIRNEWGVHHHAN